MEFKEVKGRFVKAIVEGEGLKCPCCRRWAAIYKTGINKSMIFCLIVIYRALEDRPEKYLHVEDHFVDLGIKIKGVHGKLKYWGILEQKPNKDTKKKASGYWKLTQKGIDFVQGRISVPKYVYLFDDRALRFSKEEVTFKDRFDSFDYEKTMARFSI